MIRRGLAIVVALVALARPSAAGDYPLEVEIVNMTPDAASTAASKACVKAIEKTLTAGYTEITHLGETALRRQVGQTQGEPFVAWDPAVMTKIKFLEREHSVLVLIDCRPEAQTLDVVVAALGVGPGVATIAVRDVPLDCKHLAWASAAVWRRAEAWYPLR